MDTEQDSEKQTAHCRAQYAYNIQKVFSRYQRLYIVRVLDVMSTGLQYKTSYNTYNYVYRCCELEMSTTFIEKNSNLR